MFLCRGKKSRDVDFNRKMERERTSVTYLISNWIGLSFQQWTAEMPLLLEEEICAFVEESSLIMKDFRKTGPFLLKTAAV